MSSSSAAADPDEIRARVVVLGAPHADAADEWARPELEAFHLPSPAAAAFLEAPPQQHPETESAPAPPPAPAPEQSPAPPPPPNAAARASSSGNDDAKKATPPAALRDLFRFADGLDCVLMLVGTLGALVHGCSLPVFLRFFADLVDSFGSHADDPDTMVRLVVKYAFYFLVVGAAIWASSWAEISCWMWTGERQTTRMRIRYLDAALRQDVSFFDTDVRASDVIYAINADAVLVQDAISEKLGNLIHYMATFVAGFVVGFTAAWQLALVTLAVVDRKSVV